MSETEQNIDEFDDQPRHQGLEARLAAVVIPALTAMGYELVRIAVLGRDRPTVQVMADRADQRPFTVEDCEAISHTLGAVIDVDDPIKSNWTLEVSSAGIDRPLTRRKDWQRHLGHDARVELDLPQDGRRRLIGPIVAADANGATIRVSDGTDVTTPYDNVRRAKLLLTDRLIAETQTQAQTQAQTQTQAETQTVTPEPLN